MPERIGFSKLITPVMMAAIIATSSAIVTSLKTGETRGEGTPLLNDLDNPNSHYELLRSMSPSRYLEIISDQLPEIYNPETVRQMAETSGYDAVMLYTNIIRGMSTVKGTVNADGQFIQLGHYTGIQRELRESINDVEMSFNQVFQEGIKQENITSVAFGKYLTSEQLTLVESGILPLAAQSQIFAGINISPIETGLIYIEFGMNEGRYSVRHSLAVGNSEQNLIFQLLDTYEDYETGTLLKYSGEGTIAINNYSNENIIESSKVTSLGDNDPLMLAIANTLHRPEFNQ